MEEKIWLSSPHMGGNELNYINDAFRNNWIAPLGPNVSGFEKDLEKFLGEDSKVAALSSGTAALHLSLVLLGIKPGDEVLCQSLTFAASANPITYVGATPIFIDSESDTLNICPRSLEEAIKDRIAKGNKPKAIIAVHLYGMPYKVEEVTRISKEYDIPVIEDSAEALGSYYNKKACGTFGDYSILSFNGNKIITTSGGGALVTKDLQRKEKAIFLATQARDDAPHYQHSQIGYNYRMSNISAGIGRGQMEVLKDHVELRRDNNRFYRELFKSIQGVKILHEPENTYFCNHWLSVAIFEKDKKNLAEELRQHLAAVNIESRPLWKPMHLQPVFKDAPYYGGTVSSDAFEQGLCLPSGSNLSEGDRKRISDAILEFFS
jgi:dTDP-4-amino-4,6-dideoxygalactose transaminase